MTDEATATAAANAGYWPSVWPAEDGGPRRLQAPDTGRAAPLDLRSGGTLQAITRPTFAATMCVTRDPGEVFLLCHTIGPDTISWVERIHPESVEVEVRSPDLAGGPFWPGGIAAHADGSLYVTYGRWCHRLDPATLEVMASAELPRDRPYNSLVVLPDGHLVMKDIGGGTGVQTLPDGATGSELCVLAPGSLDIVDRRELPEGSIARLSADGDAVVVVGVEHGWRLPWSSGDATLGLDPTWQPRYRTLEGQTFGWDIVLGETAGWFLDNGDGTEHFGGSFRGKTASTTPLHLVKAPWDGSEPQLVEICGEPGGIIANPPVVDDERGIAIGYDSGHGVLSAFDADTLEPRWRRDHDHAGHMIRYPSTGELVTYHYDAARGLDQVVVLDITTGDELGRVDTASPVQCVLFPAAGWARDLYVCTFAGVTRVWVD